MWFSAAYQPAPDHGSADHAFSSPPIDGRIGLRQRRDQRLGVGMGGPADDLHGLAFLHHHAVAHHHHRIGDLVGGGEIMGDIDEGHAGILPHPPQGFEDGRAQ